MSFKVIEIKILYEKKRSVCYFFRKEKNKRRSFCKLNNADSFFSFVPKYIKFFFLKNVSGERNKNNL